MLPAWRLRGPATRPCDAPSWCTSCTLLLWWCYRRRRRHHRHRQRRQPRCCLCHRSLYLHRQSLRVRCGATLAHRPVPGSNHGGDTSSMLFERCALLGHHTACNMSKARCPDSPWSSPSLTRERSRACTDTQARVPSNMCGCCHDRDHDNVASGNAGTVPVVAVPSRCVVWEVCSVLPVASRCDFVTSHSGKLPSVTPYCVTQVRASPSTSASSW